MQQTTKVFVFNTINWWNILIDIYGCLHGKKICLNWITLLIFMKMTGKCTLYYGNLRQELLWVTILYIHNPVHTLYNCHLRYTTTFLGTLSEPKDGDLMFCKIVWMIQSIFLKIIKLSGQSTGFMNQRSCVRMCLGLLFIFTGTILNFWKS